MKTKGYEARFAEAETAVLDMLANDNAWELFLRRVSSRHYGPAEADLENLRQQASDSKDARSLLQFLYIHSISQICDRCDYNPNHRRGYKKFTPRKVYDCSWKRTQGDVLAEQTATEESGGGALYKFGDPVWKEKYRKLSKEVLEQHTDRTKPPEWLNVGENTCTNFYVDNSRM